MTCKQVASIMAMFDGMQAKATLAREEVRRALLILFGLFFLFYFCLDFVVVLSHFVFC